MNRVYLDYNATAPLRAEAREAMIRAMDVMGNPSSVHAEGRAAKAVLEKARMQIAELIGGDPSDLFFTSGATEAAMMAVPELAGALFSEIEHDAVLAACKSADTQDKIRLDVDSHGRLTGTINGASIFDGMWDDVVAFQAANSETGVLQNTYKLAQEVWATKRQALILVDAVQAWGKTKNRVSEMGADFALGSGHKIGGPKGVGFLWCRRGLEPNVVIRGGGQEMGRRSGTENVIGIAGFGAAAEVAKKDLDDGVWDRVAELRNILEKVIEAETKRSSLIGKGAERLPNTCCIVTPGWKGETQVMQMDLAGFAISSGSACSSGKVKSSRVLKAMGFSDVDAASAIRVSLGPETTETEIMRFAEAWIAAEKKFQAKAA